MSETPSSSDAPPPPPASPAPLPTGRTPRARINSNVSGISRGGSGRVRRKSRVQTDSGASIGPIGEGITRDENGETSFRFRRHSLYAPPPGPRDINALGGGSAGTVTGGGGGGGDPRRSLPAIRRSCGLAGPLIAAAFLRAPPSTGGFGASSASLDDHEEMRAPRRKIKLLGCIGVIIGCVMGSGIFAAPQAILGFTQSAGLTLVVWGGYGMIALVGALCYVELGCTIPVSGGDYAYLNECFGPLAAFLFQWSANFVIIPTVVAIMASVVAKNLINPYIADPTCDGPKWATCCIAVMLIYAVVYVNYVSAELTEKIQGWLMIINLLTVTLVIVCGIVHIARFGIENEKSFEIKLPEPLEGGGDRTKFVVLQLVMALYQASFSYVGYTCVTYIMEDVENPLRTLPLAIMISLPIVIVLNVFVNFCYLASIPLEDLSKTQTVASEMMRSMVKDRSHFPTYLIWIGPTLVAIAVMGGLLSNVLTCSRVSFIGARNRHFPGIFKMTHYDKMTPVVSLAFMGLTGGIYALIPLEMLIGILTYILSAIQCTVIYGLIYTRIKKPDLPRPFKLWLFVPISYAAVTTFLFFTPILLLDETSWKKTIPNLAGAISVLFLGVPVYFIFVHRGREWRPFQKGHGKVKTLLQKMWLVLPEEDLLLQELQEEEAEELEALAEDGEELKGTNSQQGAQPMTLTSAKPE